MGLLAETVSGGPVVVTGSAGLLGSQICRLLRGSVDVVGVDRQRSSETTIVADIRDPRAMREALRGARAVVHVAALHAPHVGRVSDREFAEINVGATETLLAAAQAAGVPRFVFTSTTSVYGHALETDAGAVWVTEQLVPHPRDIYDETKLAAENLVREATGDGFATVVLRSGRCFPEPFPVSAWNRLYRGADLRDVAAAHVLAVSSTRPDHLLCNVAGPPVFRENDCAALTHDAAALIRDRYPEIHRLLRAHAVPLPQRIDRVYVSDKARRELGYHPRFGLADLLRTGPGSATAELRPCG